MIRQFQQINRLLALVCTSFALLWIGLLLLPAQQIEWEGSDTVIQPLPKGAFRQEESAYAQINGPAFALNFNPPSEQLPNLKNHILYFGKDWRPDANPEQQLMHFSLNGGKAQDREILSIHPGEKVYLTYDEVKGKSFYAFSKEPTSFWFEAKILGETAEVRLFVERSDGTLVTTPEAHHLLQMEARDQLRSAGGKWMLDETRVDGSLLARQRARWFGKDLFLQEHGGEEYLAEMEKERLQLGLKDDTYVVRIGVGGFLIWKDKRWHAAELGDETRGYPLLQLEKVEERMLRFQLWDVGGQRKMGVNLVKSNEMWRFPGQQRIRFVGARTRTLSILEFNDTRIVVGPDEWLLQQESGWIKLDTIERIEAYVNGDIRGDLFVCEGVQRRDNQQIFVAHVFSSSRSKMENIELATGSNEVRIVEPDGEKDGLPPTQDDDDDDVFDPGMLRRLNDRSDESIRMQSRSSIIERSNMIRRERQRGEGRAR